MKTKNGAVENSSIREHTQSLASPASRLVTLEQQEESSAFPAPKRCSPAEDEAFGRLSLWLTANGLTMHTPKRGAPYFKTKASRPLLVACEVA